VLFVPGGSYFGGFSPVVTMSQNMLPFEWRELRRYLWTRDFIRLLLLRWIQSRTFRRADGLIFLSQYARAGVGETKGVILGKTTIIPHGIEGQFFLDPREQLAIDCYSIDRPFRLLYVSIIDLYKHQWRVAEAVAALRARGMPVTLELVGPAYSTALAKLRRTLDRIDPAGTFVSYSGAASHDELPLRYAQAELCVFASSCENLPILLLEGMASGLPIACSNRGPMPEVLGNAGVYFDPEHTGDICRALTMLIESPGLRSRMAKASFDRARMYSWRQCASDTFGFLAQCCDVSRRRKKTT